ncbi:MAG: uracil-DNA glycosylase [Acidimicrobiaceae bacterium]|jgi:DNA polymerase
MTDAADRWREVAGEAACCRNCDLWRNATQTVFGVGPVPAEMMLVGEQPGDQEDLAAEPFVGPAGRVLDEALEEVKLDRRRLYLTNAVKHFKWTPRGKRRIHQKPNREEVRACTPWLETEVSLVSPQVVVLLGATAAQAVMGASFRVTAERGKLLDASLAPAVIATVHPSSILRAATPDDRRVAMSAFVSDLRVAAAVLDRTRLG